MWKQVAETLTNKGCQLPQINTATGAQGKESPRNVSVIKEKELGNAGSILHDVLKSQITKYETDGYPHEKDEDEADTAVSGPSRENGQKDPFDLALLQTPLPEDDDSDKSAVRRVLKRHFLEEASEEDKQDVPSTPEKRIKMDTLITFTPQEAGRLQEAESANPEVERSILDVPRLPTSN